MADTEIEQMSETDLSKLLLVWYLVIAYLYNINIFYLQLK